MFKCVVGNHVSKSGEKLVRLTIKTRTREYAKDTERHSPTFNPHGPTTGTEIVQEIACCGVHALGVQS